VTVPEAHEDLPRVRVARAAFLEDRECVAGVRGLVAASWRRSRSAGVDADEYRIAHHEDVDLDSRLVRCARPVIERMAAEMVDVPVAVALSDARARIVHRLDCSTAVGRPLDRVDFLAGFSFAEGGIGTNGIGTVFEVGAPVSVVGAEHFTEALGRFACTGAPVPDPVTGRVEGVLDVSSLADDWTPLMATVVRRAAADIGRALLQDRSLAVQALVDAFIRADVRPRQAVMAVGPSLLVNQQAQRLLGSAEQAAVQQYVRLLTGHRDPVTEVVPLPSGRFVRIRAEAVPAGDDVAGVLVRIQETARPGPVAVPRRRTPAGPGSSRAAARTAPVPGTAGVRSVTWTRATGQVASALDRGEALLVLGEPGAGKRTLVTDVFRRSHPDGSVLCVPAERLAGLGPLPSANDPRSTLLLLGHVDRLDAAAAGAFPDLLTSLVADGYRIAATADQPPGAEETPAEDVLRCFDAAVPVPPLRHRVEDLPCLVEQVLAELAPGRRVRLAPTADGLLARYAWPGNIPELRETLAAALRRRPVGELTAEDLPAACRTAGTRTLSLIERAERDAIVAVLQECGGNRLRAASSLGLARSSLYRKIKSYAITEV
jgi:transcriptional regulator of acetoin/glycerol metabolism